MAQDLSKNESDYKSHVIYVVPEEANSQKALKLLRRHRAVEEDVWVQDVRMLQAPLPAWLEACPLFRKGGQPHRGTACLSTCRTCATPEAWRCPRACRRLPGWQRAQEYFMRTGIKIPINGKVTAN